MKKWRLGILLLLFPLYLFAAEDFYTFDTPNDAKRFSVLTNELRCLVCQNQTLAESNAPLAADLRQEIYTKISQKQSDQAIVNYLVQRYGDFILYRPPLDIATIGLWFLPCLFLLLGIFYLLFFIRKKCRG